MMAGLRAKYRTRLARESEALDVAEGARDREALLRIAHGLAGSAGTFGFPRISEAAQEAEAALDLGKPDPDVARAVRRIRAEIASALDD